MASSALEALLKGKKQDGAGAGKAGALPWQAWYVGEQTDYAEKVDRITVVTDRKGRVLAALAGQQALPLHVVVDDDVKRYEDMYRFAGMLTEVRGRRPKAGWR